MRKLTLAVFCCFTLAVHAQSPDWRNDLKAWMTAEDVEESYGEETMEQLEERAEQKINLNQTSRDELEELPFLSAQQVEGLVEYIDRYGPVRSLSELQMITSIDWHTRHLLSHFVEAGAEKAKSIWPSWSELTSKGRHTLMATAKIPFYERKGDINGYLGYKYRHDLRYQYTYRDRIKLGLTGAQDAGEPFLSNRNRIGYDFYSYYFQLRKTGRLEALNLGMYRVQLGMGLVMNTGFHLGKLATLQSLGRSTHALTAHASRSQSSYLQGAAATVRLSRHWHATAFASYRALDATLNTDGTARTLLTDGYHRTPKEMEKKNNTHETDLGVSTGWRQGSLFVNANLVYTHLDRQLMPQKDNAVYRRYAAEGNDFLNMSLDYGYTHYRYSVAGETAINRDGALAMIHTLSYRLTPELSLMALHRYYDKRYTALHARSFSKGSGVQNEHGLYLGASWKPSRRWVVQGYADYAHFTWPRYQVSTSSDAFDALLSAHYTQDRWELEGRYRLHIRQRDNADKTWVQNRPEHRLRLRAACTLNQQWTLQTQADAVSAQSKEDVQRGIMLNQHIVWQQRSIKVNALLGWFHTDGYDARLYLYEPSALHDFSFPMYYGHGIHYALMAQADLGRRLKAIAKVNVTDYLDRSTISSGLQQIDHSSMTDLLIQLRYVF